jgi:hypothetical protein
MPTTRYLYVASAAGTNTIAIETDPGNGNGERETIVLAAPGGAPLGTANGGLNVNQRNLTPATDSATTRGDQYTTTLTVAAPFTATQDIATSNVSQVNRKVLLLVVTATISYAGSGQATVQPWVSTTSQPASTGAAGLYPLVDTAQNLGASGTTLPVGTYAFDSGKFQSLAQPYPFMGFRLVFPAGAPTNTLGNGSIIAVVCGVYD